MLRSIWLALLTLAPLASAAAADTPARTTSQRVAQLHRALERQQAATRELPRDVRQLGVVARLYAREVPLEGGAPVDGWGRPFVYRLVEDTPAAGQATAAYRLYSTGENGQDEDGAGDDLGDRRPKDEPAHGADVERAIQLLPVLALVVLAPVAWGFIRAARRSVR